MLTFRTPELLFFLVLIPVMAVYKILSKNKGGQIAYSFSIWGDTVFRPSQRILKITLVFLNLCFYLGFSLIIFSAAGPSLINRQIVYLSRGTDILFVVDTSPSMAAQDFPPENRLLAAKVVIQDFLDRRSNDPVGLVAFGDRAVLRVPPTLNYDYFNQRLDELKIMELGEGTAVGMGLAVAVLHLQNSSAEQKIIVLLTDGDNNAGEILPETAASIAKLDNIKIYTVGLGTEGDVPVEYVNPEDGKVYSGTLRSSFDKPLLESLAAETGGSFFHAASVGSLDSVFEVIDSIENVQSRERLYIETVPIYYRLVLIGLLLILIDFIIRKFLLKEVL